MVGVLAKLLTVFCECDQPEINEINNDIFNNLSRNKHM